MSSLKVVGLPISMVIAEIFVTSAFVRYTDFGWFLLLSVLTFAAGLQLFKRQWSRRRLGQGQPRIFHHVRIHDKHHRLMAGLLLLMMPGALSDAFGLGLCAWSFWQHALLRNRRRSRLWVGTMDHRGIIPVEGIVKSTHETQSDS